MQISTRRAALLILGQFLSLVLILILIKTTTSSLMLLGIGFMPFSIAGFVGAIFPFGGKYQKYRPRIDKINFSYSKDLLNLGLFFFVIQIAFIIQYQTANFIIAQNFGTEDVVSYNVVFKYFGLLEMISIIFVAPFWSASTEAFMKGDIPWIRSSIKHYNRLNVLLEGGVSLCYWQEGSELWLGKGTVDIDFQLSLWGFHFSMSPFLVRVYRFFKWY
ncbi:MAG: hypothetical protein IPO07_30080 [Haliscomenobacter sp.]|nr:hypothetical protein [Haliscomenobacter sp.]MBK9492564.1 hypothetical protein [Haliscomenobacter sp.]